MSEQLGDIGRRLNEKICSGQKRMAQEPQFMGKERRKEMERKLASVQEVLELNPIEGADRIEVAKILGWYCVVKKGEVEVGQNVVFFEPDAFLPVEPRYSFLENSKRTHLVKAVIGYRIRTVRLKQQISQGLVLPLSDFPELTDVSAGDDVTEALHVIQWELPEPGSPGVFHGTRPSYVPKSDETRVQSDTTVFSRLAGRPYYITTKMDGTSCGIAYLDGEVHAYSRNYEIEESGESIYWKPVGLYNLKEKFKALGKDVLLNGELCGEGIQKNKLRISGYDWFVFDVYFYEDGAPRGVTYDEFVETCTALGVKMVPLEEEGLEFDKSFESLIEMSQGKYPSGQLKEGIVVRSKTPFIKAVSFKVLNPVALVKED